MSVPLTALSVNPPPDPSVALSRMVQLKSLMGQQQLQQAQLRSADYQMQATQAQNDAFRGAVTLGDDGAPVFDKEKITKALATSGFGSEIPSIITNLTKMDQDAAALRKTQNENVTATQDYVGSAAHAIKLMKSKDGTYDMGAVNAALDHAATFPSMKPQIEDLRQKINADPSHIDNVLSQVEQMSGKQRTLASEEENAAAHMKEASKVPAGDELLGDRVPMLNQGLQQRFQVLNPKQPLPANLQLPENATSKDFDRVDKIMEANERAKGTKAQQDETNAIRQQTIQLTQAAREQAQADREDKKKERESQGVYAYDPASNSTKLMKESEALDGGLMYEKVTSKQVGEDRQLTTRLADVKQKLSRYQESFQPGTLPLMERYAISKVMADDKFKMGAFGSTLPVDFLNKLDSSRMVNNLSAPAKKMLVAYYNARESMTGYNRVLTGTGRTNEKTLELQLKTLPEPLHNADFAAEAFGQFDENLKIIGEGLPQIPGVTGADAIEKKFKSGPSNSTATPEAAAAPMGKPGGASGSWEPNVPGPGTAKYHYAGKKGEIFSNDGQTWYDAQGNPIGK